MDQLVDVSATPTADVTDTPADTEGKGEGSGTPYSIPPEECEDCPDLDTKLTTEEDDVKAHRPGLPRTRE